MKFSKLQVTWWYGVCYHKEQLLEIINSPDIRNYSHILHDKDKEPDSNVFKKPHYHFLIQFYRSRRGSWFNRFITNETGNVFYSPTNTPQNAYDYLLHATPSAIKAGKHLYDPSELISTIDKFDPIETVDKSSKLFIDLLELLDGKITWHELIKRDPKRLHSIANIRRTYDILLYERQPKKDSNGS